MDRVQKDFREYFYRETVGFVMRERSMDFVTSWQMMLIVERGWEEGGFAIGGQAIRVRRIEVRIHGE